MNAVNQATSLIKQSLSKLPYDKYNLISLEGFIQHVPDWECFPSPARLLRNMTPNVGHEVSGMVLGSYQPMNSSGVITLNQDNLKMFYWSVVREITRSLPDLPFSK